MSVTYVITFDVVPQQRSRFLSHLEGVLDAMRSEPMFHEAILHRDPTSDCRFMLYETWEDHDDVLNVQLQRPYRQAWHEVLPELLERDRDIAIWKPLRSDRAQGDQERRRKLAAPIPVPARAIRTGEAQGAQAIWIGVTKDK